MKPFENADLIFVDYLDRNSLRERLRGLLLAPITHCLCVSFPLSEKPRIVYRPLIPAAL